MACNHPLEPIFRTKNGQVFRCKSCSWANIRFGPVIIAQKESRLAELASLVRTMEPTPGEGHDLEGRCYHVGLADRTIGLALTRSEVDELAELLSGAAAMIELDALMNESLGQGLR